MVLGSRLGHFASKALVFAALQADAHALWHTHAPRVCRCRDACLTGQKQQQG